MQNKTWKPITGGILSIIAGVVGAIIGVVAVAAGGLIAVIPVTPEILGEFFWIFGVASIILGIVAIIGGIFACGRTKWSLALAGSICSLFCVWFLGIPAIILVAIGKREFEL